MLKKVNFTNLLRQGLVTGIKKIYVVVHIFLGMSLVINIKIYIFIENI